MDCSGVGGVDDEYAVRTRRHCLVPGMLQAGLSTIMYTLNAIIPTA